jgi:hypothetical protein
MGEKSLLHMLQREAVQMLAVLMADEGEDDEDEDGEGCSGRSGGSGAGFLCIGGWLLAPVLLVVW